MKYSNGDQSMMKAEPAPVWMSDSAGSASHPGTPVLSSPLALAKVLWRRKWMVASCLFIAVVIAVFIIQRTTPQYTAIASVLVQPSGPRLIGASVDNKTSGTGYLFTHCSLIASTPVLTDAASKPAVKSMKTFNGPEGAGDPVSFLKSNMTVDVGKRDSLIYLTLSCPDASDAAALVNSVVDSYVKFVDEQSRSSANDVLTALNRDREKSQKEWDDKTAQLIEFKRNHGNLTMATANTGNIVIQRLAKLSDELTNAEIEQTEAKAAAANTNAVMAARNRLAAANERVEMLRKQFEDQQKLAMALNSDEAEYLKLQTEVNRIDKHLNELIARIKEVDVAQDAGSATVKVVESATAPASPSSPQKAKILAAAILLGLLTGAGLAWVRDWTDPRLRSTDEIIATLGMPVLGMIPHMSGRQSATIRGRKVQLEFMSDVAEAYRTLRTSIYFGTRNEPAKTLLVTSPSQGDGKSTTASNLAIAMAQAGRRTLILDTDFRRPQLHKIFEVKDEIGLSSVLAGRETLDKAIHSTGVKGLEILPCGPIPSNPSEILNSDAFAKLLMSLSSRFDMIVLDSPPVSPVTDARILGAICDATLLVLKSDKSTRKSATMAADALHSVGARLLGVVCNGVMRKSGSDRYYSGYGYGYPRSSQGKLAMTAESRRLPVAQVNE